MIQKIFKINIIVISIVILFSGCFEEDKPKKSVGKKQIAPSELLVQKIKENDESNKTLVESFQDDGIVIDGARDERLLEAFDRAVAQVIIEEGVSVPECGLLSKTEFLTLEECNEITDKYFGFYEIDFETGEIRKVDDVFAQGIAGEDLDIRESEVELFDSSGNPLLDNLVEFEEMVDNSNDLNMLKKIAAKVPASKKKFKEKIDERIDFLEEVELANKQTENKQNFDVNDDKQAKEENKINSSTSGGNNDDESNNEITVDCSGLSSLRYQQSKVEKTYDRNPTDKNLDELNEINYKISLLESQGCQ